LLRHASCNCSYDRLNALLAALRGASLSGSLPLLLVLSGGSEQVAASLLADDAQLSPAAARDLRLRVLLDPQRLAYARFGCARGVARTLCFSRQRLAFNLRGLLLFPYEACCRGRLPLPSSAGDPWAQGALLLLDGAGVERFALRETRPGFPQIDEAALAGVVRAELRRAAPLPAPAPVPTGRSRSRSRSRARAK